MHSSNNGARNVNTVSDTENTIDTDLEDEEIEVLDTQNYFKNLVVRDLKRRPESDSDAPTDEEMNVLWNNTKLWRLTLISLKRQTEAHLSAFNKTISEIRLAIRVAEAEAEVAPDEEYSKHTEELKKLRAKLSRALFKRAGSLRFLSSVEGRLNDIRIEHASSD